MNCVRIRFFLFQISIADRSTNTELCNSTANRAVQTWNFLAQNCHRLNNCDHMTANVINFLHSKRQHQTSYWLIVIAVHVLFYKPTSKKMKMNKTERVINGNMSDDQFELSAIPQYSNTHALSLPLSISRNGLFSSVLFCCVGCMCMCVICGMPCTPSLI